MGLKCIFLGRDLCRPRYLKIGSCLGSPGKKMYQQWLCTTHKHLHYELAPLSFWQKMYELALVENGTRKIVIVDDPYIERHVLRAAQDWTKLEGIIKQKYTFPIFSPHHSGLITLFFPLSTRIPSKGSIEASISTRLQQWRHTIMDDCPRWPSEVFAYSGILGCVFVLYSFLFTKKLCNQGKTQHTSNHRGDGQAERNADIWWIICGHHDWEEAKMWV